MNFPDTRREGNSSSFRVLLKKLLETRKNLSSRGSNEGVYWRSHLLELARDIGKALGKCLPDNTHLNPVAESVWYYSNKALKLDDKHAKDHIQHIVKVAAKQIALKEMPATTSRISQWDRNSDPWENKKVIVWNLDHPIAHFREVCGKAKIQMEKWIFLGQSGIAPNRRLEIFTEEPQKLKQQLESLVNSEEIRCSSVVCGRKFNIRETDRKRRAAGWVKDRIRSNSYAIQSDGGSRRLPSNPFRILDELDPSALKVATFNTAGLLHRVFELDDLIFTSELPYLDVIAVQETWLFPKQKPYLPGYFYFGVNQENVNNQRGNGGLGFFVRADLAQRTTVIKPTTTSEDPINCMWITISVPNRTSIVIGNFYGPQESESRENVQTIYQTLEEQVIKAKEHGKTILVGDFNAKVGRHNRVGPFSPTHQSANGKLLLEMMDRLNMWCTNGRQDSRPERHLTRFSPESSSMIDLIWVEEELFSTDAEAIVGPNCGSDHQLVWTNLVGTRPKAREPKYKWRINLLPNRAGNQRRD